jgi:murein DD-endopeptidase MepM/ murein hydrolase activator NlpD
MFTRYVVGTSVMLVLALLAGCGKVEPTTAPVRATDTAIPLTATSRPSSTPTAGVTPTALPTHTSTPTPTITHTPTSTPTPTATPTPTPTALPATVSGDPRQVVLSSPVPQSGAPCGVVDTFDFPIGPPDARLAAYGGRDFGVFRQGYGGYHTGEDWWGPSRGSTFGAPVHSIGHGVVTYAAPLGWGADQGVVIVRHALPDGNSILSMYGHLDPPSIELNVGDCVVRGEQVGQIGDPRSPPHLHFEIRTHLPTSPGPGYWPDDPTLAGWEPPSQYIWDYRITASPGVQWTRPFVAENTMGLGMIDRDTFAAVEDRQLIGINIIDGSSRWSRPVPINVVDAMLDAERSVIYTAEAFGLIEAFRAPDLDDGSAAATVSEAALESMWRVKLDAVRFPTLMPLPGGGVVVSSRRKLIGVSSVGELLWEHEAAGRVFDWALGEDLLIVSTIGRDNSLWAISESGPIAWAAQKSGRPLVVGDQVYVYDAEGIYLLNPETLAAELLYALPYGSLWLSDMIALPDGGLLVAHTDRFDKRLIALDPDGRLRWQRSFSGIARGQQNLLVLDERAYLVAQDATGSFIEVSVFSIDLDSAELIRIFTLGSRDPLLEDTWAFTIEDNRILINIGGSSMAAFDPRLAIEIVTRASDSQ